MHISLINFGTDLKVHLWVSSCFYHMAHLFIKWYYLRYFKTFWKGTIMDAFVEIFNNFLGLRFLISLTTKSFAIYMKLKLSFSILSI